MTPTEFFQKNNVRGTYPVMAHKTKNWFYESTKTEKMKHEEFYDLAKVNASQLGNNEQIRVEKSYWVFNLNHRLFIGQMLDEPVKPHFFHNKPVHELTGQDNKPFAKVQDLYGIH